MQTIERTVADLLDTQKVVYLSSIDADGFPNTKAFLHPRNREGIKNIYFSTSSLSQHVAQFEHNSKACLYFCNTIAFQGVMLKGIIEIMDDRKTKKLVWRDGDTLFYPQGMNDPNFCVLKFTAYSGRFYSNLESEDFFVA